MNCSEIPELMVKHLTGELAPPESEAFEAHLKQCWHCAEEARWQMAFRSQLREAVLAEPVDSHAVEQRALWNIRAETARKRRYWPAGLAAAAALVLIVAGGFGYRAWANRPIYGAASPAFAAAAQDHREELVEHQPRRWRLDAASIHALAVREGVAAIDLKAVASNGYKLEQAKFCRLDGKFYLHLVYSDGHGNYSLYLRHEPGAAAGARRISASETEGDHIAGFRTGSTIAMVVTDQSGDAAVRFARAASARIG